MPYIPPIVIDTPDLIGQQIQVEQQNQQRQFQLEQMRERQEQRVASQAQSYVNRSLSNYEKGQLGKITQQAYLQKAQDAFYTWQDTGTDYYENPNPQTRQALDNASNQYRQTVGSLLAYDQEEKDFAAKIMTNPGDYRTSMREFSDLANERRAAIAAVPSGQPIPLGLSLESYIIRNDDVKPFSFVDEGVALAADIQDLIEAEPNTRSGRPLTAAMLSLALTSRDPTTISISSRPMLKVIHCGPEPMAGARPTPSPRPRTAATSSQAWAQVVSAS